MDDLNFRGGIGSGSPEPGETRRTGALAMTGPALVFGGCYSNLEATRSLLDVAAALGIPASRTICTGDIVGAIADSW